MILEIAGYAFLGLVALTFVWLAFRGFVVKRMGEAFALGMKMGIVRGQIGQDAMDQIMVDAGIELDKLPREECPRWRVGS